MKRLRIDYEGLKTPIEDFIASLRSDHVLVKAAIGIDSYLIDVKSIKKVEGYSDFWKIEGYTNSEAALLYVDYLPAPDDVPGGFGYLEIGWEKAEK